MAGRPDYQTLSATLPAEVSTSQIYTGAAGLGAGNTEQHTFYASAGTFIRISSVAFSVAAPAGASGGSHTAYLTAQGVTVIYGVSLFGDSLEYSSGQWTKATSDARPKAGNSDQAYYAGTLIADATNGVVWTYTNASGVTQNGARSYQLVGVQVTIGNA